VRSAGGRTSEVYSKDQEKEGIPAQLRRDYATNKGFVIAQEFTDVETAQASGRTNLNEMLLYLKKHQTVCRTVLVEKTDRLYLNIKDDATVNEFDVEVHYVKENTGNRGKCEEPYTRQEILAREFAEVLQELVIPQAILEWLGSDVVTSGQTEQAARAQAIKKLQARHEQIQARIETMYLDKLDERITQEFFDRQSATWRSEQDGLQRKIQEAQKATPAPIDQALDMLRLTSRARELFLQQTAAATPIAQGGC
jgi:hypothetical protein